MGEWVDGRTDRQREGWTDTQINKRKGKGREVLKEQGG